MFDIGFWELALVGIVALLVVGPERLPKVARTVGLYVGKARRFMSSVKGEIDRELKADELKRIMAEQAKSAGLYEIREQAGAGLSEVERDLNSGLIDSHGAKPTERREMNLNTQPAAKPQTASGKAATAPDGSDEPKQRV